MNEFNLIQVEAPQFSSTNTHPTDGPFLFFPIFNPIYGIFTTRISMFGD